MPLVTVASRPNGDPTATTIDPLAPTTTAAPTTTIDPDAPGKMAVRHAGFLDDIATFEPAPQGEWGDFVIQTDRARTLEAIECRQFHAGRAK